MLHIVTDQAQDSAQAEYASSTQWYDDKLSGVPHERYYDIDANGPSASAVGSCLPLPPSPRMAAQPMSPSARCGARDMNLHHPAEQYGGGAYSPHHLRALSSSQNTAMRQQLDGASINFNPSPRSPLAQRAAKRCAVHGCDSNRSVHYRVYCDEHGRQSDAGTLAPEITQREEDDPGIVTRDYAGVSTPKATGNHARTGSSAVPNKTERRCAVAGCGQSRDLKSRGYCNEHKNQEVRQICQCDQ